ncbi:MAG: protein kinase, partial [Planctomycetes bacterium]|nr:protein kinase [Planctomycetota bacterium]
MPAPASADEFLDLVHKSRVADEKRLSACLEKLHANGEFPSDPAHLANLLISDGILTEFQADNLLEGRYRGFSIGKYKLLARIGSGGMGQVYLCEHPLMRRRVAVKVLPPAKAADEASRERFYREARAAATLDHPNIVHAYDIDQDNKFLFLVMEYVDGSDLQDIVQTSGPLEVSRACHYIQQAALGLEHARRQGLVHRDIKPGNILVDRSGVAKILDMGLALFFNDTGDNLTKEFDENVLGTTDYLAPEQAIDSHGVDCRADVYSLGATFYFLLTGRTPFGEGSVAQKLLWHTHRTPQPLSTWRQGVPAELEAVLFKMMAKQPADRYQTPGAVAEALAPFTQTPIAPPPEGEMPPLHSPAGVAESSPTPMPSVSARPVTPTVAPFEPRTFSPLAHREFAAAPRVGSLTAQAAPDAVRPGALP